MSVVDVKVLVSPIPITATVTEVVESFLFGGFEDFSNALYV